MVAAVQEQASLQQRGATHDHTQATYYSIVGALSDEGWAAMQAWLADLRRPIGGTPEVPYELDPNAAPETNFMEKIADLKRDPHGFEAQGEFATNRMAFDAALQHPELGPVAARLKQLQAEKEA